MPRDVGPWARDKLKLLQLYLPGYLGAATRTIDRIYIDAFAGPGTNEVRGTGQQFDGSPLIALDAIAQNGTRFTELYFIERDIALADELERIVTLRDPEHRAHVIRGDTNVELPKLVRGKHPRAPIFVFLDTDAIEPAWSTIEAIAEWRTELLINFPLGFGVNRNPDSPKNDRYFGTSEWRALWDSHDSQARALLDLYKTRLAKLGYTVQIQDDRLISRGPGSSGQRYYYLVPVSKIEAARTIWEWVFRQPDASGQSRMSL